jgi:hypothetical protein
VATRYDKLAANYLAFIQLSSMRVWLRANGSARQQENLWPKAKQTDVGKAELSGALARLDLIERNYTHVPSVLRDLHSPAPPVDFIPTL